MKIRERLEVRHWVPVSFQGQPDGLPEAFQWCCGTYRGAGKKARGNRVREDMSKFSQVGSKIKGKLLDTVTTGSLFGSKRRISDRKEKVVYGF